MRAALDALASGTPALSARTAAVLETTGKKSILVLPFTNLSADPESDYFADGLTEEIIADLSDVRQLRVISSTSSMQFKGTKLTVAVLAQQLRVEHVLEGSVRRIGDALRITAKLIEAASDSPVWANKYSGTLADVFAIQETLSKSIVDALRLVLTAEEERKLKDPRDRRRALPSSGTCEPSRKCCGSPRTVSIVRLSAWGSARPSPARTRWSWR